MYLQTISQKLINLKLKSENSIETPSPTGIVTISLYISLISIHKLYNNYKKHITHNFFFPKKETLMVAIEILLKRFFKP